MKIVSEEHTSNHQQSQFFSLTKSEELHSFLIPFKTFRNSVHLSIIIHFLRFFFVIIVYYRSDLFLHNPKRSSEPWNSLLYFLAIMIEVIKFIGDVSLKNLLKNEQKKLISIHEIKVKNQQNDTFPLSINLKGASYDDYMSTYSMVEIFKQKHKNYASAFLISKNMHLVCTFFIFGLMSLREQFNQQAEWIQFLALCVFLYSIYFTSFELDFLMIETSEGKFIDEKKYNPSDLCPAEINAVMKNFLKWRKQYLLYINLGSMAVLIGVLLQFSLSLYSTFASIAMIINYYGFKLQKSIENHLYQAIKSIKRNQINTYSVLKKSTSTFSKQFQLQRFSLCFMCFGLVRDQNCTFLSFCFSVLGAILLIIAQIKKLNVGNKLKLMTIIEKKYQPNMYSQSEINKKWQCAICLNYFQVGQKIKILPCSNQHIYHKDCFEDWNKIKKQCPLCRYSLSEYI